MGSHRLLRVVLGTILPFLFLGFLFLAMYYCKGGSFEARRRRRRKEAKGKGLDEERGEAAAEEEEEDLMVFSGGEGLSVHAILDAPGEVVGKSTYSTLYKASLRVEKEGGKTVLMLLRFVRPASMGRTAEIFPAVQLLGRVRHRNLVPLWALYVGPRGEKLFVHPFLLRGSLFQFLKDGNPEFYKWEVIHRISHGIAEGLDHLHNSFPKPIIHGNLKSKNVLLTESFHPQLSDYGLHLLLNSSAAQEMLDQSASHGYKAPELVKLKDAGRESDVYSMGVIFLEMVTKKEPTATKLASAWELQLPASIRDVALEHKFPYVFCPELLGSDVKERLLKYFRLAMSCCSPAPAMRPDVKEVLRRLEEIGR